MALLRWRRQGFGSPFSELERMRDYMDNVYSYLANGVNQLRKNYTGVFPLINLFEDDENLYLVAELAGVESQSLDVSVKNDTLTLKGSKLTQIDREGVTYHRRERESGSFNRSLTIPAKIESERVQAVFKNGVLTVTLPKAAEAKAHQIEVKNF
ncbi:MAG: Hsp20/alpha crystallin family protein [Deltaproteobacteria bacterium]|jgi:HSP20 family protein|nr:Hsp20/alpha crystallin family protein [Deltaproteobacteria bacterium]